MVFVTNLGSPTSLVLMSVVLAFYFAKHRQWFNLILLGASNFFGGISILLTKFFMHRVRPDNMLVNVPGKSFPSGHATMATIFFTLLAYTFINSTHRKPVKVIYTVIMCMLFLLVGLSRVYLNVHWLSDVIAGFSLGLFWLSFIVLTLRFFNKLLLFIFNRE